VVCDPAIELSILFSLLILSKNTQVLHSPRAWCSIFLL